MRTLISVCLAVTLTGCASPWPVPPKYDRNTLIKSGKEKGESLAALNIKDARALALEWTAKLSEGATGHNNTELFASEVLYYGTLLTVFGAAVMAKDGAAKVTQDARKARNIGAGLATGATLFTSRYHITEQEKAFRKAAARMQCALDAIAPINPLIKEEFDEFEKIDVDGKKLSALYDAVPRQMIEHIEKKSLPDLEADLNAIALSQPSREELSQIITKWEEDRKKAAAVAPDALNKVKVISEKKTDDKGKEISTKTVLSPATVDSFSKLSQEAKDRIKGKSESELDDERRRFVTAIMTFPTELTACHTLTSK